MIQTNTITCGDALAVLQTMPDESVHMAMTSPPYWQVRDYHVAGQLGLEPSYDEYVMRLCRIFDEVKRVLRPDGTCWVNIADSYSGDGSTQRSPKIANKKSLLLGSPNPSTPRSGLPRKCLCLVPFRFAIEMVRRGWILRNTICWHKPNVIPESMRDRFTVDFEYVFLFVKSRFYHFEQQFEPAIDRGYQRTCSVRNKRCVWAIPTKGFAGNHFATYPEKLVETPIQAGCPKGGVVLDPFLGTGTTAVAAERLGRRWVGIELNPAYVALARQRLRQEI